MISATATSIDIAVLAGPRNEVNDTFKAGSAVRFWGLFPPEETHSSRIAMSGPFSGGSLLADFVLAINQEPNDSMTRCLNDSMS